MPCLFPVDGTRPHSGGISPHGAFGHPPSTDSTAPLRKGLACGRVDIMLLELLDLADDSKTRDDVNVIIDLLTLLD